MKLHFNVYGNTSIFFRHFRTVPLKVYIFFKVAFRSFECFIVLLIFYLNCRKALVARKFISFT